MSTHATLVLQVCTVYHALWTSQELTSFIITTEVAMTPVLTVLTKVALCAMTAYHLVLLVQATKLTVPRVRIL